MGHVLNFDSFDKKSTILNSHDYVFFKKVFFFFFATVTVEKLRVFEIYNRAYLHIILEFRKKKGKLFFLLIKNQTATRVNF